MRRIRIDYRASGGAGPWPAAASPGRPHPRRPRACPTILNVVTKNPFKHWVRHWLESRGYALFNTRSDDYYARDSLFTANSDHFRQEPEFRQAYARGLKASCGVDPRMEWRIHVALWAALAAVRIPGDFVECGVNAGFVSSAIMQRLRWHCVEKRFLLVDTFAGPVFSQYSASEEKEGRPKAAHAALTRGAYVTDLQRVRSNFSEWPNVEVTQGVVPDVLPSLNIGPIAFLHLDMNCAHPERAALEYLWPFLSPGAFVLLDDYAYFGYQSLRMAIDAAAKSMGFAILSLPTGQGLIIK
jgi:Macrocin-O-methyltransferase (TylF)